MNVVAMGVMIGDRGFTPVANLSSGDIPPASYQWHPLFGLLAFCFMFVQPFVAFVRQAIVLFWGVHIYNVSTTGGGGLHRTTLSSKV